MHNKFHKHGELYWASVHSASRVNEWASTASHLLNVWYYICCAFAIHCVERTCITKILSILILNNSSLSLSSLSSLPSSSALLFPSSFHHPHPSPIPLCLGVTWRMELQKVPGSTGQVSFLLEVTSGPWILAFPFPRWIKETTASRYRMWMWRTMAHTPVLCRPSTRPGQCRSTSLCKVSASWWAAVEGWAQNVYC